MEIILLEDVDSLGNAGEIVNVKPGYARNFLFSHGLAVRSSKRNRAMINERKAAIKARTNREAKVFEELLSQLKNIELTIEVEVGEDKKLFGSVTNKDIHKAILKKGIEIERNTIELEAPIKSEGIYDVNVKISKGLSEKIKVFVIQAK
tara:strand:- start:95 stop:541 length:447 start_codon:yes stop_codon:yes gene_type:complete